MRGRWTCSVGAQVWAGRFWVFPGQADFSPYRQPSLPSLRGRALASARGCYGPVMVPLRVATYWAVWCGSPSRHPLQCWGRESTFVKITGHHISESEPESLPWGRLPIPLRNNRSSRASPCIPAPGLEYPASSLEG